MVENCVKTVRRGGTVDDAYLEGMYSDVEQMYRLGEQRISTGSKDLGPLPATAVVLLCCIGFAWLCMGIYVVKNYQMRYNSNRSK